ncbi:MAG: TPR domain protein, putative component of TonB system, partial [uncultured Gemmatimonadaceae bacterium]
MSAPAAVPTRDQEVLRSFARRIDAADAGAHNNLGVLYFNKGMHAEAVGAFTRALELDPKMHVAQRNLEIAYFNTGYYDRREAELRERLRLHPDDRDARRELGRTYALLGEGDAAIREFQALLRLDPHDAGVRVQLGFAAKAAGDLAGAQRWFEEALARDPGSSIVHFYRGEALYNRGLNDEARAALARAIELNPANHEAHYLLGFVLGDMGLHAEARESTRRALALNASLSRAQANLSLDRNNEQRFAALVGEQRVGRRAERRSGVVAAVPDDRRQVHYSLGLAFRQKGYHAEALAEYERALAAGEDGALVRQAMAEVHLLRRDAVAAVALYDHLLAARGDRAKLWNERGVALHQDGHFDAAAESYLRGLSCDPGYALARNNLGVAQFHAGDEIGAAASFAAALAGDPRLVKARLNLALLHFKSGRMQLSLDGYKAALAGEPENAVAWNGVGMVLSELRRFEEARSALARAVQARPAFAEARYNLSFVLTNLGDFDGALRETNQALALDPFYVTQPFALAIDLEYEDPDLSVAADLGGARRAEAVSDFSLDAGALDSLFADFAPAAPTPGADADSFAMAADFLSKGLYDRATAEVSRALARGADAVRGLTLLGDVFTRQGAPGEALERYAAARELAPDDPAALAGEARALL